MLRMLGDNGCLRDLASLFLRPLDIPDQIKALGQGAIGVKDRPSRKSRRDTARVVWRRKSLLGRDGLVSSCFAAGSMMTGGKINMSYVMAAPEMITAAATDVAAVGSALSAAHGGGGFDRRGDTRGRR
jgi:hypothetical protein